MLNLERCKDLRRGKPAHGGADNRRKRGTSCAGDSPKGSFFNLRTGASYDNLFKFLSSTSGFDAPPAGRIEDRNPKPLRVTGTLAAPDAGTGVVDAGQGASDGGPSLAFEPVADTFTDPLSPGTANGGSSELRAGGDGRTIYLRFNVQGVQHVS
ncbi:MAG: hypothetical protein ACYC8T_21405 [Myxococcaceae bacterium]